MNIPEQNRNRKSKHNIFIVDDHPVVREGLTKFINHQRDLRVCGEAGDISSALQAVEECNPDAAIVDISLGSDSGLQLIQFLANKKPGLPILVLSMHDELAYAERCIKAGAKGYIMKQERPQKVISALRKVLTGGIYLSDKLEAILLNRPASQSAGFKSPLESLSRREFEVFQLIGQGLNTSKIAGHLNISVNTIETHIEHIKKKMHLNSSRELFLYAVKWTTKKEME